MRTVQQADNDVMQLRACEITIVVTVVIAVGCRTAPKPPAGCESESRSRRATMIRQVAGDTAAAAAAHSIRAAYSSLTEPFAYLRAWESGIVEKRVIGRSRGELPPICADRPTLDVAALEEYARRISKSEASPAGIRLCIDGEDARSSVHEVIESAHCRIDVLMYLWGSDTIGWEVARHLAAKAGPNLPVRVLVDGGGNLLQGEPKEATTAEVNAAVCWLAAQPCVTVIRTRDPCYRLDHRKLVVADGCIAWSGGRNFVDAAFFEAHDLTYTVTGPLAGQMASLFDDYWERQGGTPNQSKPTIAEPTDPNAKARIVRTTPTERAIAKILYDAVIFAQHHVYAENPYFSDNHLIGLLIKARRRGVDVRVVLTLHSDSKIFDRSNRVIANRLLAAGIRVYLYPGMTHAKALAVDGVWAYTGTGNFDNLSLRHNRELGLAINEGPVIGELEERLFLADMQDEWELTEPLPVGPLDYLAEFLASTFT
jgi:cardiolipin synthase A/B